MPRRLSKFLIRKIREHNQDVPIIIVTAWGKESFVPTANAILGKPVRSQDLKNALVKVVRQRKQEGELKSS